VIEDFIILPKVKEALAYAKEKGYKIIVLTNQRTVPEEVYNMIHSEMLIALPEIDDVFVCPHETGECNCRKPLPGLFYQAAEKYNVDKTQSLMVGDSQSDLDAATAYGVKAILSTNLYETVKELL